MPATWEERIPAEEIIKLWLESLEGLPLHPPMSMQRGFFAGKDPTNSSNLYTVGVIMFYGSGMLTSAIIDRLRGISCLLDDLGVSYWTGYNAYNFPVLFVNAKELDTAMRSGRRVTYVERTAPPAPVDAPTPAKEDAATK